MEAQIGSQEDEKLPKNCNVTKEMCIKFSAVAARKHFQGIQEAIGHFVLVSCNDIYGLGEQNLRIGSRVYGSCILDELILSSMISASGNKVAKCDKHKFSLLI